MSTNPFVGTWQLISNETKDASGEVSHPFGKDATGYVIYSEDGHMAHEGHNEQRNCELQMIDRFCGYAT